jgi:hypothetical protein
MRRLTDSLWLFYRRLSAPFAEIRAPARPICGSVQRTRCDHHTRATFQEGTVPLCRRDGAGRLYGLARPSVDTR